MSARDFLFDRKFLDFTNIAGVEFFRLSFQNEMHLLVWYDDIHEVVLTVCLIIIALNTSVRVNINSLLRSEPPRQSLTSLHITTASS